MGLKTHLVAVSLLAGLAQAQDGELAQGLPTLDTDAMNALDAQIGTLRNSVEADAPLASGDFIPPEPFICVLPTLLDQLDQDLSAASELTQARWQVLLDEQGIEASPGQSLSERCALYQSMIALLDRAGESAAQCQPVNRALRLATLVTRVPRAAQPQFGALLADLARQQAAVRAEGGDSASLCPAYDRLETLMLQALSG